MTTKCQPAISLLLCKLLGYRKVARSRPSPRSVRGVSEPFFSGSIFCVFWRRVDILMICYFAVTFSNSYSSYPVKVVLGFGMPLISRRPGWQTGFFSIAHQICYMLVPLYFLLFHGLPLSFREIASANFSTSAFTSPPFSLIPFFLLFLLNNLSLL